MTPSPGRGSLLIALGVLYIANCGLALAEDYSCQDLRNFEMEYSGRLPLEIDGFASLQELRVDCEARTIEYIKQLKIDESQLAQGFRTRKQAQYQSLHCNEEGVARHGWTSIDNIFDKNEDFLVKLIAKPHLCNRSAP